MTTHRAAGPRGLAATLPKIIGPLLKRRGFARAEVLTNWRAIVGDALAARSCPEKLSWPRHGDDGATLRIRVASGWAPQLQHLEPLIVERINTYFGYRAVGRLKLTQGPVPAPRRRTTRRRRQLTEAEEARLQAGLAGIDDPDLAAALRSLGQSVLAAEPVPSGSRSADRS